MKASVQRWGSDLAIRIPHQYILEAGLAEDAPVEMAIVSGNIVISPPKRTRTLAELLAGVTPENLHSEWDTGPALGGEIW